MIAREMHHDICVLRLERGHGNALSLEFLAAIQQEVESLRRERPRGLVLTGSGSTFCAGLDLEQMLQLDRGGIRRLLQQLYGACRVLFSFPRPVVAAVNGHAIAGGALLALACDLRLMSQGEGKFGLNESTIGLCVPPSLVEMGRYTLGRTLLEKLMYGGQVYAAYKAYDMGILDFLVDEPELIEQSTLSVERWTSSVTAFAEIKARLKAPTLDAMTSAHLEDESWIELWFRPETQQRVRALLQSLKKKES
jgi:enoyl-CoA hydratase/carnithine racemase